MKKFLICIVVNIKDMQLKNFIGATDNVDIRIF